MKPYDKYINNKNPKVRCTIFAGRNVIACFGASSMANLKKAIELIKEDRSKRGLKTGSVKIFKQ